MSLAYFDGITMPEISVWAGVGSVSSANVCVRGTGVRGTHIRGVNTGSSLVELPATDIRSVTITRGRDQDTNPATPGTCAVVFDNTSGNYDHTNLNSLYVKNMLAGDTSDFEATVGTWAVETNVSTPTRTTAQAHSGTASMLMSSVAAGNMTVRHAPAPALDNGLVVDPSTAYRIEGWFRAAVSARSVQLGVNWYDSTGAFLSTVFGSTVTDSTSAWTAAPSMTVTSPSNAARAIVLARVQSTGGAAEQHYVDDVQFNATSAIELGVALEVRVDWAGVTYQRFSGQIVDLAIDAGFAPTATWTASDGLEKLGRIFLPTEVVQFEGQRSGERIGTIADRAGWPTILRALDTGVAVLSPTAFGDFALELMRKVEASELGFLFVDGMGQLVFYDRYRTSTASRSTGVQASFADTATGSVVEMDSVELSRSRERIYNRAVLTRDPRPLDPGVAEVNPPIDAPREQQADNTAAQVEPFGVLTFPNSAGQFLANDSQVKGLCELIVDRYGPAANRIREVAVAAITQDVWSVLLPLTLLDRISVSRDYGPNTIAAELLIQGMTETITDAPSWDYTFSTSEPPAAPASMCVRGDGVRGTDSRAL